MVKIETYINANRLIVPGCFEIDAIIIHNMMIDHVMCMIVEKMAFVVNVISVLLKISAISSNMHAVQPGEEKIAA